jgi:cell division protein FtsQ
LILFVILVLSPLFNIKNIEVYGLTRYLNEDVIRATNILEGNNWYKTLGPKPMDILTFSSSEARNKILSMFPYIQDVSVKFVFLGNVKIRVTERVPEILVSNQGQYIVLDNAGRCLEVIYQLTQEKLPVLANLKIKNAIPGNIIEFEDPYVMESVRRLFYLVNISDSNATPRLYPYITEMDFSNLGYAIIVLDGRVKVNIGDINKLSNYKINFLKEVFFKKIQKEEKGSLDFSRDDNPVFNPGE